MLLDKVRAVAKERGITVNKLEKDISILGQGSIKGWDKHMPSIDRVAAVADYFGVTVDYLVGYEGDPDTDLKRLMEMASWLTEDQLVALLAVAEQLKGK